MPYSHLVRWDTYQLQLACITQQNDCYPNMAKLSRNQSQAPEMMSSHTMIMSFKNVMQQTCPTLGPAKPEANRQVGTLRIKEELVTRGDRSKAWGHAPRS